MSYGNDGDQIIDTINLILDRAHLSRLRNKHTRTHGGEWAGPCPMCKREGSGGKNEDRLLVWPLRPLEGHGSKLNPVFYCRRCEHSGDLPQFVQDALGLTYGEARMYLGLSMDGYTTPQPRSLMPTILETGAPNLVWQEKAKAFMRECVAFLWGPKGEAARKYLMEERRLTEETLRLWQVGWQPDTDRWDNPCDWGRNKDEGRLRIWRGMVFPELHLTDEGIECWSVSIRRPPNDLDDEFFETGHKPAKYPAIRGSQKGLLGTMTMKRDKPLVLAEGHLDALTAWQVAHDLVGVCATQSVGGGRDPRSVGFWLPQAKGVILCFDPDAAGEGASDFWDDTLPCRIRHTPLGGDLNAMLMQGMDVRKFIEMGVRKLHTIYPDLLFQITPQDDQGAEKTYETPTDITPVQTEAVTVNLGPSTTVEQNDLDALWEKGCVECGAPISEFIENNGEVRGYCEAHMPRCCCGERPVAYDHLWHGWCRIHVVGTTLIDKGKLIGFPFLCIPRRSKGWVKKDGAYIEEAVWETQCEGGPTNYYQFAATATPAQLWCAAHEASAQSIGCKPTLRSKVVKPCSNWHCDHDVNRARLLEYPDPPRFLAEKEQKKKKPPIVIKGRVTIVHGCAYNWCPHCTDAAFLLALAEELGWVAWDGSTKITKVPAGADAWVHFCQNMHPFTITFVFDNMRRRYQDAWAAVQDFLG